MDLSSSFSKRRLLLSLSIFKSRHAAVLQEQLALKTSRNWSLLSSYFRSNWSPWGVVLQSIWPQAQSLGTQDLLAATATWSSLQGQSWRTTSSWFMSSTCISVLSAPNISQHLPLWDNTLQTTLGMPQLCAARSVQKFSWTKKNWESTRKRTTQDWNLCRAITVCALSGEICIHRE